MEEKDLIEKTLGKSFDDFYNECKKRSSGYGSMSASSGEYSTSASSGDHSTSASNGDGSTSASSGNFSTSASIGSSSKSASSGYGSMSASSGDSSTSASSGNFSTSASSGYGSKSASNGSGSKSASSGNHSTSASIGSSSKSASSGNFSTSASSGDYSSATCNGYKATVKGSTGNVIVAVEFDKDRKPIGFAGGIVGKDGVKEGVEYTAYKGKLHEVDKTDGIFSIVLSKRGGIIKATDLEREYYIVTNGNESAHGDTIKEARKALEDKVFALRNKLKK